MMAICTGGTSETRRCRSRALSSTSVPVSAIPACAVEMPTSNSKISCAFGGFSELATRVAFRSEIICFKTSATSVVTMHLPDTDSTDSLNRSIIAPSIMKTLRFDWTQVAAIRQRAQEWHYALNNPARNGAQFVERRTGHHSRPNLEHETLSGAAFALANLASQM